MCEHMLSFRRAMGNCMHRVHGHAIRLHEGLVPSLSLSPASRAAHGRPKQPPVALPPLQPARDPQPARTVRLSLVDIPSRCVQLTRLIVLAAMSRPTSSPLSLCLSLCLCLSLLLLLLASAAAACPVPPTDPLGPGSYGLFLTHDGLLRYTTRLPA